MKDVIFDDFQNAVDNSLLRHKSILDIMSKLQESEGRINRAVTKSATNCGCIKIEGTKQNVPYEDDDIDIDAIKKLLKTQIKGTLCENCREIISSEIGNNIFYLAALCNVLDLNLYDILLKEYDKINTLGQYSFR